MPTVTVIITIIIIGHCWLSLPLTIVMYAAGKGRAGKGMVSKHVCHKATCIKMEREKSTHGGRERFQRQTAGNKQRQHPHKKARNEQMLELQNHIMHI